MKKSFVIPSCISIITLGLVTTAVASEMDKAAGAAAVEHQASVSSNASSIEPKIRKRFVKLDKNSDGYIDAAEAKKNKRLNSAFNKIASAGKVDETSFAAWVASSKKK